MANVEDIRKLLKEEKLIVGTNRVVKDLKLGKLKLVYVTSNCPDKIKENIRYYAGMAKTEVVELKMANDSLGTLCKKPFSISILGVKK